MKETTVSDEEIMSLLRDDNPNGLKLLYTKYERYLSYIVQAILGDSIKSMDIVQDVITSFWEHRRVDNIDINRGTNLIRRYLRASVIHSCSNKSRQVKSEYKRDRDANIETIEFMNTNLDSITLLKEINRVLRQAPIASKVFHMSYHEQKNNKEIAQELGISVNTVRNHLAKAFKHIRAAKSRLSEYAV